MEEGGGAGDPLIQPKIFDLNSVKKSTKFNLVKDMKTVTRSREKPQILGN